MMTARRYSIHTDDMHDSIVTLRIHRDCALGDAGDERTFWAPSGGGYVYETDDQHPGSSGRQVCGGLARHGSALTTGEGGLAETIRREARVALRAAERAERTW